MQISSTSIRTRAFLFVLALGLACGDGESRDPELVYDFGASLSQAEVRRQVSRIEFGTPDADPHLVAGFGLDQLRADGTPFVIAEGERSVIRFLVNRPGPIEMELDCAPFRFPGARGQEIVVSLNGEPAGRLAIGKRRRTHSLALPGSAAVRGMNTLELRYPHHAMPDPNRLVQAGHPLSAMPNHSVSVILYSLRFHPGAAEIPDGSPEASGEELRIPLGTRIDYHLMIPAGTRLEIEAVRAVGEGVLEVLGATPDGQDVFALEIEPSSEPVRIPLPMPASKAAGDTLIRVSLVALARDADVAAGEIVLRHPRLRAPQGASEEPEERPNIVIYLSDTLRRDHLGVYGYHRPTSPRIDAFAGDSVVFDNAAAHSSWTRPTVVSLFTGLNPRHHGVTTRYSGLPEQAITLAEALRARGYETSAFGSNAHVSPTFGLDQGFTTFVEEFRSRRNAEEIHAGHGDWKHGHTELQLLMELALDWLHRRDEQRPFFLFLHTTDPHNPYKPLDQFREVFAPHVGPSARASYASMAEISSQEVTPGVVEDLRDLYDAEIATNDYWFGALLDELGGHDFYDDSLIVFLSDHGEEFNERGLLGHGSDLHSETQEIPLIVKFPARLGRAGRRIGELVSQIDVFATLMDLLRIELPGQSDGRSVEPILAGVDVPERPVFAHVDFGGSSIRDSITEAGWKLIRSKSIRGVEGYKLYQLSSDPHEKLDVAVQHPSVVARLRARLDAPDYNLPAWESVDAEFDEIVAERLEALGYIQRIRHRKDSAEKAE